ncbi:MAG: hypothetical protein ACLFPL_02000 [Candidatus Nanoarchaeia archaeon]
MYYKKQTMNKKGAIEMSLNLIIMLVIGLTVLGLIISFVNNFLTDATDGIGDTLSETEEQRLEDIQTESGNLVIQPSQIEIGRGDSQTLFMKMENPTSQPIEGIFQGGELGTSDSADFYYNVTGRNANQAQFSIELNPIQLDASQIDSYRMIVSSVGGTPVGNYFLTFRWETPVRNYSESVTVVVE